MDTSKERITIGTGHSGSLKEASAVTLLLADWKNFGLSERVSYHFDLLETLPVSSGRIDETKATRAEDHPDGVCGVVSLLECVPKVTKYHRRELRNAIRSFNLQAQQVRNRAAVFCHEPQLLPLRLSPSTRVSFAYEVTKIAFCLDASPSLVSSFGASDDDDFCCAIDRLSPMVRTFFRALVEPIRGPIAGETREARALWEPILAVTVIAVFPQPNGPSETALLVRDFRVHDERTAECLSRNIEEWALGDVEHEIASRMNRPSFSTGTSQANYNSWKFPTHESSLRHIFDAGDVALGLLPSHARPCIVLATDCRSVACEGILDLFSDSTRFDTPLVVLDLSGPSSHEPADVEKHMAVDTNFLVKDPGGQFSFPLYLSDDSENLYEICRASGGCFMDAPLLQRSAKSHAGPKSVKSALAADPYFSFRRRMLRPNGVQWYILFLLSPLSPMPNAAWGRLVPPSYLRKRLGTGKAKPNFLEHETMSSRVESSASFSTRRELQDETMSPAILHKVFSAYVVSPIRIKGLLLMRVKEGYRAKQYGQSTQESGKVSIQLSLPLEFGTVIHYEISYTALQGKSPLIGGAHIKISLSGESRFIHDVKNDFLDNVIHQRQRSRTSTVAIKASERLCKVLRWLRKEDCLQSYLCPLEWQDKLSGSNCPFARRLGTLSQLQRDRHFRVDEFDVVCTGRLPYETEDDHLLSEFIDIDDGQNELAQALAKWSTVEIREKQRYVKKTSNSEDDLTAYCVIEVNASKFASRLFTISVETFGGGTAGNRLSLLSSLVHALSGLDAVAVLRKQMNEYLVGLRNPHRPELKLLRKHSFMESHFHHESWEGVKDSELLPLLTRRRSEVGEFWFLHSSEAYSLFAKLVHVEQGRLITADRTSVASDYCSSELYQVQYQIAVLDKVVIDMHVEREQGVFFRESARTSLLMDIFERVRKHDQECGRALFSRTRLLQVLNKEENAAEVTGTDLLAHVRRLLKYASQDVRKLRFFHAGAAVANTMLEDLTSDIILAYPSAVKVGKLPIESNMVVSDIKPGIWFLIQFDWHTICIVHLSLADSVGLVVDSVACCHRELTFFTIGISDLYCKRDIVADDDSADDHVSEYMCTSEFADVIEDAHGENYARAAYLALRGSKNRALSFEKNDFDHVLKFCTFLPVASVTLSADKRPQTEKYPSLLHSIESILSPVPDDAHYLFYHGVERSATSRLGSQLEIESLFEERVSEYGERGSLDVELEDALIAEMESADGSEVGPDMSPSDESDYSASLAVIPPIFIRFSLDQSVVPYQDLAVVDRDATLTCFISLFRRQSLADKNTEVVEPMTLPNPQSAVARELRLLLNSYISEQSLWRLLHRGSTIEADDLMTVSKCLKIARSVQLSSFDVQFYVAKMDNLIPASAPAGGQIDVEEGFSELEADLWENETLRLVKAWPGRCFVDDSSRSSQKLGYWCFLTIQKTYGVITFEVYHPDGEAAASLVLTDVQHQVARSCHRVNQILMLRSLHRSRNASTLLIPKDESLHSSSASSSHLDSGLEETEDTPPTDAKFLPGSFCCPIRFRATFPLYHRVTAVQAILSLEATVLHSFALSNRRGYFVYKDESEAIFYMKLEGASFGGKDKVDFLVFGVLDPGESVTFQLANLLQKRLMSLGVEALSSLLTKNPHFNWKHADMDFVRSFRHKWQELEPDDNDMFREDCLYAIPSYVYDPIMLFVYFRQNICGSTFFHPLHGPLSVGDNNIPTAIPLERANKFEDGARIPFDRSEFSFFHNNSPSPLNPELQPVSTLTEKGAQYSREAGSGIALINVDLLTAEGDPISSLISGQSPRDRDGINLKVDPGALHLTAVNDIAAYASTEPVTYLIRVKIVDTAINRKVLHSWVLLSLNQVLVAWTIERHLEISLLHSVDTNSSSASSEYYGSTNRECYIESMKPGLPYLVSILESSICLPHPAIGRLELKGMIKASSVVTATLTFLEKCVLSAFRSERKPSTPYDVFIMRLSRQQRPRRVKLLWDCNHETAVTETGFAGEICDSPIDCPEYLCFFCLDPLADGTTMNSLPPMLFREVMPGDGITEKTSSSMTEALLNLKKRFPEAFRRSFLFILSVKRNERSLITYNWNPQVLANVKSRLGDTNSHFVSANTRSIHTQQQRCLRWLSPSSTSFGTPSRSKDGHGIDSTGRKSSYKGEESSSKSDQTTTKRPFNIRRPKLVGKSVEGAAIQALAASRARASANRFSFSGAVGHKPSLDRTASARGAPYRNLGTQEQAARKQLPKKESNDSSQPSIGQDDYSATQLFLSEYSEIRLPRITFYIHCGAIATMMLKWWVKSEHPEPLIRDFLLSRTHFLWSESFELFAFPERVVSNFSMLFTQWLRLSIKGFTLVEAGLTSTLNTQTTPHHEEVLVIQLKNMRRVRLCLALKISTYGANRSQPIVGSKAWLLVIPSDGKERGQRKARQRDRKKTLASAERSVASVDKKFSGFDETANIEKNVFNFALFLVERSLGVFEEWCRPNEVLPLLHSMIRKYTLRSQLKLPGLQYNVFKANILLSSYSNPHIDLFDAHTLFAYLSANVGEFAVTKCDDRGLLFSTPIVDGDVVSRCFLTREPVAKDNLQLVLLCRTGGRRLGEFVFREGSPVAVSLLEKIIVSGAALARDALELAAIQIYRDRLWKKFASAQSFAPSEKEITEMLSLATLPAHCQHLHSILFDQIDGLQVDWIRFTKFLEAEPVFLPHRSFVTDRSMTHIAYVSSQQLFVALEIASDGSLIQASLLVNQTENTNEESIAMAMRQFVNYLTHFIWQTL